MSSMHRRPRDWIILSSLLGVGAFHWIGLAIDPADMSEVMALLVGNIVASFGVFVAVPFATGSQTSTPFHRVTANLLLASATIYLSLVLYSMLPPELNGTRNDNVVYPLFAALALFGGFCVVIGTPLSFLLYLVWWQRMDASTTESQGK
jgi:hypothetical protein